MVSQIIRFVTTKRKDVENLEKLLHKTLPQLGIKLVPPIVGVKTEYIKKQDWGVARFSTSEGETVKYEYILGKNNVYNVSLDLSNLPFPTYSTITDLIESSLPKLAKQTV
ncbi:MAG: hypothetical protein Q8R00_00805 [Candidatus Nanoarchaeia archaeon]|nr:hypothetical protein [Candidatus Nanoarchaeia archaeon]